jgi:hypothetical protein
LYLNGRLIGEKPLYNNVEKTAGFNYGAALVMTRYAALFEVPYEAGELVAVADNGSSFTVKTSGKPAGIRLTPDRDTIGADNDLCYVTLDVCDAVGSICHSAANKIHFSVDNGCLLALGTSNPKDTDPYTGSSHSVYDGQLMAVIRSDGRGDITLKAFSDNLNSSSVKIKTK